MTNSELESQDLLEKVGEMLRLGQSVPLDLEEASLRIHLRNHPDRSDLLQRLCAVLAAQGKAVSLELEERALVALIKLHPDREDIRERLRVVRLGLGVGAPPSAIIGPAGEEASQTNVDFQAEAEKFSTETNFRDLDAPFNAISENARRFTMTSIERMYALYKAVEYVVRADIQGAILECGVWRGGSIMVALATLMAMGKTDREIFLFDTFEGLPRPDDEKDIDVLGNRALDGWLPHSRGNEQSNWAYASLSDVRANISSTGYPIERIHFIKGMVENTLPAMAPATLALCRLDTDWYASTKHEMTHLFPRISVGGVLIIDDYGHFKGARDAVDEYLSESKTAMLLNRIDYAGRIGIKIAT